MGTKLRGIALVCILLICSMAFVACEKDTPTDPVTVTISAKTLALNVGDEGELTAQASDGSTIVWSTSNSSVAVYQNGKVKAIAEGSAVLTAKSGDAEASCKVTVTDNAQIKLTFADKRLKVDEQATLEAEVLRGTTKVSDAEITYEYDAESTVIDVVAGDNNSLIITGVAEGTESITVKFLDKLEVCIITVYNEEVEVKGSISSDIIDQSINPGTFEPTDVTIAIEGSKTYKNVTLQPDGSYDLLIKPGTYNVKYSDKLNRFAEVKTIWEVLPNTEGQLLPDAKFEHYAYDFSGSNNSYDNANKQLVMSQTWSKVFLNGVSASKYIVSTKINTTGVGGEMQQEHGIGILLSDINANANVDHYKVMYNSQHKSISVFGFAEVNINADSWQAIADKITVYNGAAKGYQYTGAVISNIGELNNGDPVLKVVKNGKDVYVLVNDVLYISFSIDSLTLSGRVGFQAMSFSGKLSEIKYVLDEEQVNEAVLALTEIRLSANTLNIIQGQTATLTAWVNNNSAVEWLSSDESVAKYENGQVIAVGKGTAVITARAAGKKVTCNITVTSNIILSVEYQGDIRVNETTDIVAVLKREGILVDGESITFSITEGDNVIELTGTGYTRTVKGLTAGTAKVAVSFENQIIECMFVVDNYIEIIGTIDSTIIDQSINPGVELNPTDISISVDNRVITPEEDGSYNFRLSPGSYTVKIVDKLGRYADASASITLTEGTSSAALPAELKFEHYVYNFNDAGNSYNIGDKAVVFGNTWSKLFVGGVSASKYIVSTKINAHEFGGEMQQEHGMGILLSDINANVNVDHYKVMYNAHHKSISIFGFAEVNINPDSWQAIANKITVYNGATKGYQYTGAVISNIGELNNGGAPTLTVIKDGKDVYVLVNDILYVSYSIESLSQAGKIGFQSMAFKGNLGEIKYVLDATQVDAAIDSLSDVVIESEQEQLELALGQNTEITAWVNNGVAIVWTSADEAIAKYEDGKIVAVGIGETVITATAGTKTAQITVIVKAAETEPEQPE